MSWKSSGKVIVIKGFSSFTFCLELAKSVDVSGLSVSYLFDEVVVKLQNSSDQADL